MRIKILIVGALMCGAAWWGCIGTVAAAECQLKKVVELAVRFDAGRPLVPVTINGKRGWMGFSNRSNTTAIFDYAALATGLKPYPTSYFTNNNGKESPVDGVYIAKFGIGDMAPQPIYVFVVPKKNPSSFWGNLNASLFPGDTLDIDYPNRRIRFYREENCVGKSLSYWSKSLTPTPVQHKDLATFFGEVDGKKILYEINSTSSSWINQSAVQAANLTLKDSPLRENGGRPAQVGEKAAATVESKVAIIHQMRIGDEIIDNAEIKVSPDIKVPSIPGEPLTYSRDYETTNPRITLGIDFLLSHHVLISPAQFVIYVSREKPDPFEPAIPGVSPTDNPEP